MKNIRLVAGWLLIMGGHYLFAQSPVFQSCSGIASNIYDLTNNDSVYWNDGAFWDPSIETHDLADANVDLVTYVSKGCPNSPGFSNRFTLFLDLDGDGSRETEVSSDATYAAGTINYNNANGAAGTPVFFDHRTVSSLEKYRFRLKSTQVNDSVYQLKIIWIDGAGSETVPQLPYGVHRLEWSFSNACGATATCGYDLVIRDGKKPAVMCINNLSLSLINPDATELWATDLLQYTEDNYTPSYQIQIGIRRVGLPDGQGNTTGFPKNADGTPQLNVAYTCADLLTPQSVELWARDAANNPAFCQTSVNLLNDAGNCNNFNPTNAIRVHIAPSECPNEALDAVTLEGDSILFYNNDYVLWGDSIGTVRTITPQSNLDLLNCVNTWDLVLISHHILNVELLNSPYKIIAADVNKSGTVTTFDIVELRKLILGVYNELPNNLSWRFVNKNQTFPNALNPFTETLQESITVVVDSINPLLEFVGIKIGNVDECCGQNYLPAASDRSVIVVPEHTMQAGEEVELTFPGNNDFYAWQMTLEMSGWEIVEIIPFNGLTSENFGIFEENDTTYLTFSAEAPQKYFNLRLRALQSGLLSNMLRMSNAITPSLSYDANGVPSPITLEFTSNTTDVPVFSASLTPNPWTTQANLQFTATQSGTGVFTVSNALGQVIYTSKETCSTGTHIITLNRQQIPVAGTYWCRLALNGQVQVVKMVITN